MITSTYQNGNSYIHKTDPRMKLFLLVFFTVSFFITDSISVTSLYFLFIMFLIGSSIGIKGMAAPVKTIYPLLIFVALLTPPFHPGGTVYLRIGSHILVSNNGIMETLRLIIRFTGITGIFFLFFRTTSIDDLILSLRWFHVPFTITLILTIAIRYIPHMIYLYTSVTDAHKLRKNWNSKEEKISFKTRIKNLFPVLVSVLIQSIKAIPTLAMSLELKGFGSKRPRSRYMTIHQYYSFPLQLFLLSAIVLTVILSAIL